MKIIIEGAPKEIAALVLEIQKRQGVPMEISLDRKRVAKAITEALTPLASIQKAVRKASDDSEPKMPLP